MRLLLAIVALLVLAPAARADTFSLQHYHSGTLDAEAQGDVTFPDAGGAVVNVTVSDRAQDGWCGDAWVRSNLPPSTHKLYQVCDAARAAATAAEDRLGRELQLVGQPALDLE